MKLNPETVLKRRPYLRLTINSGDEVQVSADGKTVKCGLHALSILELFSEPLPVADAIRQLGARVTAGGRVAAIATLFRLYEGGVLREFGLGDRGEPAVVVPHIVDASDGDATGLGRLARSARLAPHPRWW